MDIFAVTSLGFRKLLGNSNTMENLTVGASDSIYYCTSEIVINIFPNNLIYVAAKFSKNLLRKGLFHRHFSAVTLIKLSELNLIEHGR